jgi:Phage portal protein, SPP1 Gp6-like
MALAVVPSEEEPGSPYWWVQRLMPKLARQAERAEELDEFYRGENALPPMCPQVRSAYQRLMNMARTNFSELIVEAVRERMTILGFRTGASDDPAGDANAWALWQENQLDADADLVHRAKLSMGCAYIIVGRDADGVTITPEDPRQVYAEHDPVRRRRVRAAIKVYRDDLTDLDTLYLYLPGVCLHATRPSPMGNVEDEPDFNTTGWRFDREIRLPARIMPVVSFLNRPDLYRNPQGEFEAHLGHLERIQYVVLNRLEIATLQAFRQRALKGVPDTDEHGDPIDYDDIFAADPGSLWLLPETADLWESNQVDLTPLLMSVKDDVEALAAVTRTPMHYFAPASANQSADGASLARESLIFKTRDQLRQTGESWEQVMSLAFTFADDPERAARSDMEVIWANPERYSLSEQASAASQVNGILPWRTIAEEIFQRTPQEIERMDAQRAMDMILDAMKYGEPNPFAPPEQGPPPGEEEEA